MKDEQMLRTLLNIITFLLAYIIYTVLFGAVISLISWDVSFVKETFNVISRADNPAIFSLRIICFFMAIGASMLFNDEF